MKNLCAFNVYFVSYAKVMPQKISLQFYTRFQNVIVKESHLPRCLIPVPYNSPIFMFNGISVPLIQQSTVPDRTYFIPLSLTSTHAFSLAASEIFRMGHAQSGETNRTGRKNMFRYFRI